MIDGRRRRRREAAELPRGAERHRTPVRPLTELLEGIDAPDAYEIQLINIRRRTTAKGARVTGHKVGLFSPVTQAMMGVDQPDHGHLLDTMELRPDAPVRAAAYCAPRIEPEVGFVLGAGSEGGRGRRPGGEHADAEGEVAFAADAGVGRPGPAQGALGGVHERSGPAQPALAVPVRGDELPESGGGRQPAQALQPVHDREPVRGPAGHRPGAGDVRVKRNGPGPLARGRVRWVCDEVSVPATSTR
ncbi:hypothetical protein AB0D46_19145 [Streptomyces sp. NPDC048383]|uniref:hypothetical protein n=1 Tax=Streptomyces sp. NPDC048383 TaxID=3155386 RepID=UPI0034313A25